MSTCFGRQATSFFLGIQLFVARHNQIRRHRLRLQSFGAISARKDQINIRVLLAQSHYRILLLPHPLNTWNCNMMAHAMLSQPSTPNQMQHSAPNHLRLASYDKEATEGQLTNVQGPYLTQFATSRFPDYRFINVLID